MDSVTDANEETGETEAPDATSEEAAPSSEARTGRKPRPSPLAYLKGLSPTTMLVAVVGVLVVAFLIFSVVKMSDQNSQISSLKSVENSRAAALSTATTVAVELSTYDYQNLTGPTVSWTKAEADFTSKFRSDFLANESTLRKDADGLQGVGPSGSRRRRYFVDQLHHRGHCHECSTKRCRRRPRRRRPSSRFSCRPATQRAGPGTGSWTTSSRHRDQTPSRRRHGPGCLCAPHLQ